MLQRSYKSCPLRNDTVSAWVEDISTAWARGAAGTLELARIVAKARANLEHGEWSRLWQNQNVPFSKRKGEMLVVIGEAVGELNAQNSAHLPMAWNTLYYLARLGHARLKRLIEEGRVHSDLSLREARALLAEFLPGRSRREPRLQRKMRLARFMQFVRSSLPDWSAAEREFVRIQLLQLTEEIAADPRQASIACGDRDGNGLEPSNGLPRSRPNFP